MDSELISTLNNIASKEGIKGVLVADERGLCLGVRGVAKPELAAFVASIANTARNLDNTQEDKAECHTINIEYENNQIVIRNEGTFTLAIFM